MMAVLFIIALSVCCVPIVMTVLVTLASRSEDSKWSLGGPAVGPVERTARRVLDFHTEFDEWPRPKNHQPVPPAVPARTAERDRGRLPRSVARRPRSKSRRSAAASS